MGASAFFGAFLTQHALRPHEIDDDTMAPTLSPGDAVLVRPIAEFIKDGIYLIGEHAPRFYRVARNTTSADLTLISDNPIYSAESVTRSWFREHVLGIVVFRVSPMLEA